MADVGMAWTTGVVAFVAAVPLWRFTTHAITVAHEGGHAMFGSLTGLLVKKIKIEPGGNGGTGFNKEVKDWGLIQTLAAGLAGYFGPSMFGLAGAWMLVHDIAPRSVLLMTLVLMAILLVMVRNLFGLFVVPLTAALFWLGSLAALIYGGVLLLRQGA